MANFERLQELRDFMAALPEAQVRMDKLLIINRDEETLGEARQPSCGTVACIAGWGACLFGDPGLTLKRYGGILGDGYSTNAVCIEDPATTAAFELSLSDDECGYVFYAGWHPEAKELDDEDGDVVQWSDYCYMDHLPSITKAEVIAYLDKAIAAKDVMVAL